MNVSAFEIPSEAGLVDALREQARPVISLVAEEGGAIGLIGVNWGQITVTANIREYCDLTPIMLTVFLTQERQ